MWYHSAKSTEKQWQTLRKGQSSSALHVDIDTAIRNGIQLHTVYCRRRRQRSRAAVSVVAAGTNTLLCVAMGGTSHMLVYLSNLVTWQIGALAAACLGAVASSAPLEESPLVGHDLAVLSS